MTLTAAEAQEKKHPNRNGQSRRSHSRAIKILFDNRDPSSEAKSVFELLLNVVLEGFFFIKASLLCRNGGIEESGSHGRSSRKAG